jgi:hypothetical protein
VSRFGTNIFSCLVTLNNLSRKLVLFLFTNLSHDKVFFIVFIINGTFHSCTLYDPVNVHICLYSMNLGLFAHFSVATLPLLDKVLYQMLYNVVTLPNMDCSFKLQGLHVNFVVHFVGIKSLHLFLKFSITNPSQLILFSFIISLCIILV